MCGIVGARDDWLRNRGLEPRAAMQLAADRLLWRGSDGIGITRIGDWWLGCARLAITQPNSHQPVVRRNRPLAAVLNGAITNARELWNELLPGVGDRPAPPNDAWLPLLAVERDRRYLLDRLRGHHALAIVDGTTNELVLRQDRFAEKPLLRHHHAGELVAFASTGPALAAVGAPPPGTIPQLATFFDRGFAAWQATDLAPEFTASPTPADLRERLLTSVARCTDTTVTTGLLLSGGIDSSCLAAAMHARGRLLPTYQFCATGSPTTERELARAVAERFGLPFHPIDGGPEVLEALPKLTELAGLPLGDPSTLAVHAVASAAAADGVRVLLGGEGADELFYGYRRYRALTWLPRLPWLRATAPKWSMRYPARWWRAVVSADPIAELLAVTPPAFTATVLAPEHERSASRTAPADRIGPNAKRQRRSLADTARDHDLTNYLPLDLLAKVDVATMAAGVESRCPFLEGDLDANARAATDLGKRRLRAAFARDLPRAVFRQRKRGFALPLDRWFRGDLPWLDLLRDARTLQRPHLRPGGVADVIDRHRRGAANLGHGLYLLVAFELHLRSHEELIG
ncbi:MAG: asparagine synthetase B [bacterium]|nr:asparagine synthetase B [bacterium]